ncbi:MAG TPA: helix-turn-helix domain-containing protein [Capillimicrobium sp.]|nr:helix-turn-helix domain-containing protein [Capillimicrobium sp.]
MRADARRNRESILAAAKIAFGEHGTGTQMDDVAARAGVGVGTVYRHFPTKEALLAELVVQRFEMLIGRAREAVEEGVDDALFRFLRRTAEDMASDAAFQQVLMFAGAPWEAAAAQRAELQGLVQELIDRGKRAGLVRDDMRALDVPLLMGGVCVSMGSGLPAHADWRRHLDLVIDALRPGPPPPAPAA